MKGYVTIFFTIAISLCMSLILVSLSGVRDVASRARIEESASISINSIYGEYQKELWGIYNLAFVDAGYSYKAESMILPEEHLMQFMNKNFDEAGLPIIGKDLLRLKCIGIETDGVRFASDDNGAAIRKQACDYMRYKTKIAYVEKIYEIISDYEKAETQLFNYGVEYEDSKKQIDNLDDESSFELKSIKSISNSIITKEEEPSLFLTLRVVFNSITELSRVHIDEEFLISNREKNTGNIKSDIRENYIDKILFREYLMQHCENYISKENEAGLKYEIEYLVSGRESDLENLESVLNKILLIRESCNLYTLINDSKKIHEIDTVSKVIATLVGAPEASEAIKAVIIMILSYIESVSDLKELTNGKSVPFIKETNEWRTSFLNFKGNNVSDSQNEVTYEDYLRLFLYFTKSDELVTRFMNVVEVNVSLLSGNEFFRLDYCFDAYKFTGDFVNGSGKTYKLTRMKDIEK